MFMRISIHCHQGSHFENWQQIQFILQETKSVISWFTSKQKWWWGGVLLGKLLQCFLHQQHALRFLLFSLTKNTAELQPGEGQYGLWSTALPAEKSCLLSVPMSDRESGGKVPHSAGPDFLSMIIRWNGWSGPTGTGPAWKRQDGESGWSFYSAQTDEASRWNWLFTQTVCGIWLFLKKFENKAVKQ